MHSTLVMVSWFLTFTNKSWTCFLAICSHKYSNTHAPPPLTQKQNTPYAGFRLTCRSPLCRYAAWSSLPVSELQLSLPLWLFTERQSLPSWIEFNCLRSAAVGKAARLSIYWLDAACRLVIPLRQVALAQLNKYHHQSGNAASGKLVWNQH